MKHQEQAAASAPAFVHNEAASQYELHVGGEVAALAAYTLQGNAVRFTHTEVQPQYEGQGLGSKLAAQALDDVRSSGRKAVPQCRFIAKFIEKHAKDYGDLVA